ncbi:hypothetical protein CEXT_313361 [Caerostris extrusa]|uniref:Uncharacterized protein n=1 Tax=Caerostris extrusa TaxID=172846 RepID=A0AAV4Y707_CAEEX|nr:hypothetical protein CEXT_313361 [Caerostris extrusa]
MRLGEALSRPLTTPERTSRRHAPTLPTETESTSSGSINPSTLQKCLPRGLVFVLFLADLITENETSFPNGVHLGSGAVVKRAAVNRKDPNEARLGPFQATDHPRKDLPEARANSTYGNREHKFWLDQSSDCAEMFTLSRYHI